MQPISFVLFFLLLFSEVVFSQNTSIEADEASQDLGDIENVNSIKSKFVIKNITNKAVYIMRADARHGIDVTINNKKIAPNDTSTLSVSITPKKVGSFNENIKLVCSADAEPYILTVNGNILSINVDDKTACFYFNYPEKEEELVIIATTKDSLPKSKEQITPQQNNETIIDSSPTLDTSLYKSNNITFIIDISASMRDTMRLPLLKRALNNLFNVLRPNDLVSIVAYSDSAVILVNGLSGNNKEIFKNKVNDLIAKGPTMGGEAIIFSLDLAVKNYIANGNNQLFLITDGKFTFSDAHKQLWDIKIENHDIILSSIAVGNSEYAFKHLKELSEKTNGSFISIQS